MTPLQIIPLIASVAPMLVTIGKTLFKTKAIQNEKVQTAVHSTLPLLVGLAAAILNAAASTPDGQSINWINAVVTGLAGGASAAYLRDFDKNVTGIADAITSIFSRKKAA